MAKPTAKLYEKIDRKTLIKIILDQERTIDDLRKRTLDDYVRELINAYR